MLLQIAREKAMKQLSFDSMWIFEFYEIYYYPGYKKHLSPAPALLAEIEKNQIRQKRQIFCFQVIEGDSDDNNDVL